MNDGVSLRSTAHPVEKRRWKRLGFWARRRDISPDALETVGIDIPGVWLGINIAGETRPCAGWLYEKMYGHLPEDERPEIVWRSDPR